MKCLNKYGLFLLVFVGSACAMHQPRLFRQAVSEEKRDVERLLERGDFEQAIEELNILVELDPKNMELLFWRGAAYQKGENWEAAMRDYQKILKKNRGDERVYYNLGMIYAFQQQDPAKALKIFDRFLDLKPHHPKAAKVAQIMVSLDSSPENGPTCPSCQEVLGNSLIQKGNPEQGYLHLMKAKLFRVAHQQNQIYKDAGRNESNLTISGEKS